MKKILTLLICLAYLFNLSAQDYEIDWGLEIKSKGMIPIGVTDDYYFYTSYAKKNKIISMYDFEHKHIKDINYESQSNSLDLRPYDIISTTKGNYLIFNENKGAYIIKAKHISKLDNNWNLGEIKQINEFGVKRTVLTTEFFDLSDNKEYILGLEIQRDWKSTIAAYIKVYDADFELLWENEIEIISNNDTDIVSTKISNNGEVFVQVKEWLNKEDKEKGTPNYLYSLYKYDNGNVKDLKIEMGNGLIPASAEIVFKEDDGLYLIGTYVKEEIAKNMAKGFFITKLDNNLNKQIFTKNYDFESTILKDVITEKSIENDNGLRNLDVNDILVTNNGNFIVLSELTYTTLRMDNGSASSTTAYNTSDIIMPHFNIDGELLNVQNINKSFSSATIQYTSYTLGHFNDKIYLLFNDGKTREERAAAGVSGNSSNKFTDIAVINNDGDVEFRKTLFSDKDIDLLFFPSTSFQVNDTNKLLLNGLNSSGYKFGVLNMDN